MLQRFVEHKKFILEGKKYLSIKLKDETEHSVSSRMLRPEVELRCLEVPLTRRRGVELRLIRLQRKPQLGRV